MTQNPHPRRAPGTRADITAQDVIEGAVAVYRAGGLASISMRAVAAVLAVAPNALYSHVKNKDDLIDGLIDALLGEISLPDPHTDWQEGLFGLMAESRAVLLKYGDVTSMVLARATRGPNAKRLSESSLEYLHAAGLSGQDAVEALRILLVYTVGYAAQEYARLTDPHGEARMEESRAAFSRGPGLPRTREAAPHLALHPDAHTFERGLRWLIQGIAASAVTSSRSASVTSKRTRTR